MQKDSNINAIMTKYPFLKYNKKERAFVGYIYIDEDDKYHLKIDISDFPNKFPKVFEIDERIPRKADRHINVDNSLCFTTSIKEEILLKTKVRDLLSFFEYILIPYLVNNSYYEINKQYKFGAYNHHPEISTYESYKDILEVDNINIIENILLEVVKGRKYRPNDPCYCGSGKKIKKCNNHRLCFQNLKRIDMDKLKIDIITIAKLKL